MVAIMSSGRVVESFQRSPSDQQFSCHGIPILILAGIIYTLPAIIGKPLTKRSCAKAAAKWEQEVSQARLQVMQREAAEVDRQVRMQREVQKRLAAE
jgi:hypothetical protein